MPPGFAKSHGKASTEHGPRCWISPVELVPTSDPGQDAFQQFFFPTKPRSATQARVFDAVVAFAHETDAWLRARSPV